MSRLMTMVTLMAALVCVPAQADSTAPADALQTVRAYFTALQNADVVGLGALFDGRMKSRLDRVSGNSAYADQLRRNYGNATFKIGSVETRPALVLVDYETTDNSEALTKRLYLRQGHDGWRIIAETTVP